MFVFFLQERERIFSEHRLKALLELYGSATTSLRELYEDKDGERKIEVASLSGPNEFSEFYSRLKQIKEFYKKHPNEISVPLQVEFDELSKSYATPTGLNTAPATTGTTTNSGVTGTGVAPVPDVNAENSSLLVEFSDEEGFGRYLDLHECYGLYLNIRGVEKADYITYLMTFDHVFDIPKERKNMEYKRYLETLIAYLSGFVTRVRPLIDLDTEIQQVQRDFEQQWQSGQFVGWPKEQESAMAHTGAHLDLSAFSSWEELASLGLDRLKSALMALGIKCGGTLEERAQRLFSTKGKRTIDPTLMAKKDAGRQSARDAARNHEIATLEAQLYRYAELVTEQRTATKENVQRKQARTEGEREDSDAEASESDGEDDDADDVPYNPKNLPLGWDGKPIPYWLYKLHGLNISYSCEICGNYTYKGPKAFQRHFAEWRHAHGMRCLGIPNTAHFANVTQIEDAITRELLQPTIRISCSNFFIYSYYFSNLQFGKN